MSGSCSDVVLNAGQCTYTNCYCEENVWKMCEQVKNNSPEEFTNFTVVIVSNTLKMVPLWYQKAAETKEDPVVWDYHVILVHTKGSKSTFTSGCPVDGQVYDLDTTLSFPCEMNLYFAKTFRSDDDLEPRFHRLFRVIPASVFLMTFASDRSHMRRSNGEWIKRPPDYPCIRTNDDCNNLATFINMDRDRGVGQVLTIDEFIKIFTEPNKL